MIVRDSSYRDDMINAFEKNECNVLLYHHFGAFGEGMRICFIDEKVTDRRGFIKTYYDTLSNEKITHGDKTIDIFHQIAPEAEVYAIDFFEDYTDESSKKVTDWILDNKIDFINASTNQLALKPQDIERLLNAKVTIISSVGNKGEQGEDGYLADDRIIGIGAVHYNSDNEKIELAEYSSRGKKYIDFCGFSNLHLSEYWRDKEPDKIKGTSFSSPWAAGVYCVICSAAFRAAAEQYNEKMRRKLYWDMRKMLEKRVVDLGAPGYDELYGTGLMILPKLGLLRSVEYKYLNKDQK